MSFVVPPDPLTVPTWLTAIFTGVLAAGAIVTAVFAIRAFRKQSQEVRDQASMLKVQSDQLEAQRGQLGEQQKINAKQTQVLELQSRELSESIDERKRNSDEQRRSRAALVYVTADFATAVRTDADPVGLIRLPRDARVSASVHNTGQQPVYDVRVHWVDTTKDSQAGESDSLGTIPPGEEQPAERVVPDGTPPGQFVPVVFFRDAAGLRWTLLPDGQLDEVDPAIPPGAPVIAITAVMRAKKEI